MAIIQRITQGFMRPIEMNTTLYSSFWYSTSGGGSASTPSRNGVEGCILTVLSYISTHASFTGAGLTISLTDEGKVKISHASQNVGIPTINEFSRLLGFTSVIAATTTSVTATYHPLYCWFPTHHSFDGSRWWREPSDRFRGKNGPTGGKFGVTMPSVYRRNFQYSTNVSANTYQSAETDYYTVVSTDYFPSAERSFEAFVDGANTADLIYADSGNVNPKGVYYIDRAYDYFGDSPTRSLPSTMDAGGINFSITTTAKRDNYLFTQLETNIPRPAQTDNRVSNFYEPVFTLVSDDTPDTVSWVS